MGQSLTQSGSQSNAAERVPLRRADLLFILGFWTFIASNVLWIVWGVHDEAWALIALQAGLAGMNVRAIFRNEKGDPPAERNHAAERRTT